MDDKQIERIKNMTKNAEDMANSTEFQDYLKASRKAMGMNEEEKKAFLEKYPGYANLIAALARDVVSVVTTINTQAVVLKQLELEVRELKLDTEEAVKIMTNNIEERLKEMEKAKEANTMFG